MKASHRPRWTSMKTGKSEIDVYLKSGQFIFGRHSAAKKLKIGRATLYRLMEKYEIDSAKQKY